MVEQSLLGVWVAPILLIPGLALLTISTGNRLNQALNAIAMFGGSPESERTQRLLAKALIWLYTGIAVNALAGIVGGALSVWLPSQALILIVALACAGVITLLVAAGLLIVELM